MQIAVEGKVPAESVEREALDLARLRKRGEHWNRIRTEESGRVKEHKSIHQILVKKGRIDRGAGLDQEAHDRSFGKTLHQ
jgi:hypothetical protein